MMLLDLLRSRPYRIIAAVLGLLVVLVFAGLVGIAASGGRTGSARLALFVSVGGLLLAGAALSYVVVRNAREIGRLHAWGAESAEQLARSEERLRLLAENAGDMVYRYRLLPTRGFEYVSPAATAITGFAPEEYYADPDLVFKVVHPDDRHLLEESFGHTGAPLVLRWRRKNGSIIWTEQRNKPVHDEAGDLVAIEGIARDITEAKQAEEELRLTVERLDTVLAGITDAYLALDEDWRFLAINRVAEEKIFRRPARELIGKTFHEEYPQAVGTEFYRQYRTALTEKRPVHFEAESDGLDQWYEVHAYPLEKRLDVYLRDITDRKRSEKALRESEERFRATFENAAVGIAHFGLDGAFLRINSKLCEMVGYTREELLTTDWMSISHPAEVELNLELRERHLRGETKSYSLEKRYIHKQGREIWIELTANLQRDENGRPLYYIAFMEDISARKKAEEALREGEERLRLALEAASLGLWYQDLNTGEFVALPRTAAMHGLPPDTSLNQEKALAVVHHEDRDRVRELVERAVATRGPYNAEYRVVWPDGTIRW
ncbi:MAG TPA: PAS domain S-box protein, partial [Rubrobacteraceae bacterium]|nr:PAS domain S-box protein [Rubrobacteraceae bacterium]